MALFMSDSYLQFFNLYNSPGIFLLGVCVCVYMRILTIDISC